MAERPLVMPPDEFALLKKLMKALDGAADVVVVRPGETLVIRVPATWTPQQLGEYNAALTCLADEVPFALLAVPGDELAVAPGLPEEAFTSRVAEAINALAPVVGVDGRVRVTSPVGPGD